MSREPTYRLEVLTEAGWRPAVQGTHNQTGMDDRKASTFPSMVEAEDAWIRLRQDCDEARELRIEVQP